MFNFSIVVAIDSKYGIGKNGQLPWRLPADLKHFKEITTATKSPEGKNVVIMGRVTWESLPLQYKPLPNRINVVLSRNNSLLLPKGVLRADSLDDIQGILDKFKINYENIFIIGGAQIFQESLKSSYCNKLYITHIKGDYHCDTFFPSFINYFIQTSFDKTSLDNGIEFYFAEYEPKSCG